MISAARYRCDSYQQFSSPVDARQPRGFDVTAWHRPRTEHHPGPAPITDPIRSLDWQGDTHRPPEAAPYSCDAARRIPAVLMNGSSLAVVERSARSHSQDTVGISSRYHTIAACQTANPRAPNDYIARMHAGPIGRRQYPVSSLSETSPLRVGVAVTNRGYTHF